MNIVPLEDPQSYTFNSLQSVTITWRMHKIEVGTTLMSLLDPDTLGDNGC